MDHSLVSVIIGLLITGDVLCVLILLAAIWFAIHSRHWRVAWQAASVEKHDQQIAYLLQMSDRSQGQYHDMIDSRAKGDTRIWEELKLIVRRLDRMQCPMGNPDCPLNDPAIGAGEVWTEEQRNEFRRKLAERKEGGE